LEHKASFPLKFWLPVVDFDWLRYHYDTLQQATYKIYSSFNSFADDYMHSETLVVQGPGIVVRIRGINSEHGAEVHGFITGKEVFGIIENLTQLGTYLMEQFKLRRLEVEVPAFLRGVNRLLEKIGFSKEGTLRLRGRRGKIIYDTNIYSIVR